MDFTDDWDAGTHVTRYLSSTSSLGPDHACCEEVEYEQYRHLRSLIIWINSDSFAIKSKGVGGGGWWDVITERLYWCLLSIMWSKTFIHLRVIERRLDSMAHDGELEGSAQYLLDCTLFYLEIAGATLPVWGSQPLTLRAAHTLSPWVCCYPENDCKSHSWASSTKPEKVSLMGTSGKQKSMVDWKNVLGVGAVYSPGEECGSCRKKNNTTQMYQPGWCDASCLSVTFVEIDSHHFKMFIWLQIMFQLR